jgi:hypothetical protein
MLSNAGLWPTGEPNQWALVGDLTWELGRPGGEVLTIPDGFVTDLATIPGWAQALFNPFSPDTAPAALIHDALLSLGYEQRVAAGEFYHVMTACGVKRWKRILLYLSVVLGSDNWDNHEPLSKGAV